VPKERGPYTPEPKQLRVVARHLAGESNRGIADAKGMDRETVGRILTRPEVEQMIAQYQQQLLSLVPKAIGVYDEALSSDDERISFTAATKLLEGLQVIPRGNVQIGDMAQKASPPIAGPQGGLYRALGELRDIAQRKSGMELPEPAKLKAAMAEIMAQGKSVSEPPVLEDLENLATAETAHRTVEIEDY